jgi:DNA-binding CsgD family transcriptional regulator
MTLRTKEDLVRDVPGLSQMSELIGRIYAASLNPSHWKSFLELLAFSFGSEQALLLNVDSKASPGGLVVTTGMDLDVVAKWKDSKEHVDPWFQACQYVKHDTPYFGQDLCTDLTLRKSAFYADSLTALDIEYTLGGISVESEVRNWIFSIFSSKRNGEFTNEQKALYQLLISHIGRAMEISQKLEHGRITELALSTALDLSSYGVVLLDENRNHVWLNKRADSVFIDCDGITVCYGRLSLWSYSNQKALDQAMQSARSIEDHAHDSFEQLVSVERPSNKKPYHLLVCPLSGDLDIIVTSSRATWLVLIHDPEERKELSEGSISALYRLTPAEARLCVTLYETCSLSEAIDTLGVSRNTAKTHLKRIFEKIGVSSQTELMLVLSAGFHPSRGHPHTVN